MKESRQIVPTKFSEPVEVERYYEPQDLPAAQYPGYRENYAHDGFQLVDYWRAVRKRLWLVVGITVLCTTLATIYMARKPNIYQTHAIVQIDNEQNNPDLVTNDRLRPVSSSDPSYFNTQLQLLNSDSLLRKVIKNNNLDAEKEFQIAKNENAVSPFRSFLKSIGLATDDQRPERKPVDGNNRTGGALPNAEDVAEAIRLNPYVDIIHKSLSIEPIRDSRTTFKDTRLIEISFRHSNPDLAAKVCNAIAQTFTEANQEKRSGTSRKTNDYLSERIASLESDIKSDEEKLVNLTSNAGILKTEGDQTIVIERLSGLNKQLLDAENKRKNDEAAYLALKNSPERVKAMAQELNERYITEQENIIRQLRTDLLKKVADLQQARALKLQEYKETAPEIREIDVQINSINDDLKKGIDKHQEDLNNFLARSASQLLQNKQTEYLKSQQAEEKIRTDFNKQYNEAQGQNGSAVNIRLLQQTLDTNRGFLENLRKQVSGNDVAAKGADNNITVIEPAIPNDVAVSPRRLTTVTAALLLSTMFGMGLALFLEYLDDSIRTTEEIENYLQLPALAAIPRIDSVPKRKLLLVGASETEEERQSTELLINADTRSSLAEAYRQLRTSILLSTAGRAPKSLLITSSLPSEGKTTTATNTAISLAQTGAKVLIIDADMRRPRLHGIFDITNNAGLSTLLSSNLDEIDISDVIQQDRPTQLFLLPSGPIPPNPAELLGSDQMAKLLRLLQEHFTHVVVDSPPIASFTDGVLIASMVDGVILVVHSGKSSRQVVRRSRQLLKDIGARIFGVVLNNVDLRSKENYYYYQSYYHRDTYKDANRD